MDYLVKKNVMKKVKLICDIGTKYTKLMVVRYANKKIQVLQTLRIESSAYFWKEDLSRIDDLAKAVRQALDNAHIPHKMEVSVSLPSSLVINKMIKVKNAKTKELGGVVVSDPAYTKINSAVYEVDWANVGSREVNGDHISYCLISAASKSTVNALVKAFKARGLNITAISNTDYNLICLSQIYQEDYNHLDFALLDFGAAATHVAVFNDGIPIYVRDISIGYSSYTDSLFHKLSGVGIPDICKAIDTIGYKENIGYTDRLKLKELHIDPDIYCSTVGSVNKELVSDIQRIFSMCEEEGNAITKIIVCSPTIPGTLDVFVHHDMTMTSFSLYEGKEARGKDFELDFARVFLLDNDYAGATGLAVSTMI